jgi:hypothetical protein
MTDMEIIRILQAAGIRRGSGSDADYTMAKELIFGRLKIWKVSDYERMVRAITNYLQY